MFDRVGAVVLFVDDLDTCLAFYRDVLELRVAMTDDASAAFYMAGHDFALLKTPAAAEMVGEQLLAGGASHRVMLCADVENVDVTYAQLTAKGVKFLKSPMDQQWGIRAAYFADPAGNYWEIRHSLKSASTP